MRALRDGRDAPRDRQGTSALAEARRKVADLEQRLRRVGRPEPEGPTFRGDLLQGLLPVAIPPGSTRAQREALVTEALTPLLDAVADERSLVLVAAPIRYVHERPGRDAEGRTVLEVWARAEGDRLVPAVRQRDGA
jgi:hypothetical protein